MQFQASLGMCLQDSKTETGLALPVPQMEKIQESKIGENKDLQAAEWTKAMEGICCSCSFWVSEETEARIEDKMSSVARGELEAEPGWPRRTPDCPPGLLPLCYMVSLGGEAAQKG